MAQRGIFGQDQTSGDAMSDGMSRSGFHLLNNTVRTVRVCMIWSMQSSPMHAMRYALLIGIDGIGTKSNRTAKLDQIGKINRANTQTKAFRTLLSMTLIAISSRRGRCILARHGLASFMFF